MGGRPPRSDASFVAGYQDASTAALLAELECWRWDLAELDADTVADSESWAHPASTRAFIVARIEALEAELRRREHLRFRPHAPAWPATWPNHRPDAEAVKARLSVADYLAARGVALERHGDRLRARCPLPGHDDRSPSFMVYPGDRGWYCFGCHRGGDLFVLHLHLTGRDSFAAAVAELAKEAGVPPTAGGMGTVDRPMVRPGVTVAAKAGGRRPTFVEFVGGKAMKRGATRLPSNPSPSTPCSP